MKRATVLQVFVASPSDVDAEREALESAIAELNQIRSAASGIRLELIRWETHARPGFGVDAQDVINRQIGDGFDIFIGVMWTRFGTPTGRAGSGTEEEFNRVFERWEKDKNSVSILLYFKEAMVDPSSLDLAQLAAVRAFQDRVKAMGGLYWTFRTTDELEALLRAHLASELTEWETRIDEGQANPAQVTTQRATSAADALLVDEQLDDDLGFLDFIDVAQDKFAEATAAVTLIGEGLTTLGQRMDERAKQINDVASRGTDFDVKAAKRVSKRTAEDMEQFVSRAAAETPVMAASMQRAIQAFGNAATFASEAGPSACEGLKVARQSVADMQRNMLGALESLSRLRATVASLPRFQKDLNVAKRKTVAAFDSLLQEIESGQNLAETVRVSMETILREVNCS